MRPLARSLAPPLTLLLFAALPLAQENVLYLLADDLGVDYVGAYGEGADPPPTPNIDALAAGGVLFRNAWSQPLCSPTRATVQTGRYALRTQVGNLVPPSGPPVLSLAETTLPELLDAELTGHAHAAIGKWHLDNATGGGVLGPNLAGWSHFAGLALGGEVGDYFAWQRTVNGQTATSNTYATTQTVDDALAWIRTAPEPWVCHVYFAAPHEPYHAPPSALHTQVLVGGPEENPIPHFRAAVEALDTEIGRLLASLDAGVLARTNVFFAGDNGTPREVTEAPFDPKRAKGTLYEGGLNVPFLVCGPAVGAPGREEAALVGVVDSFATIAELCGAEPLVEGRSLDSVSLVPLLAAPGQPPPRTAVYAELYAERYTLPPTLDSAAIRDERYKLLRCFRSGAARDELFDLVGDPFETSPLDLDALSAAQQAAYDALRVEMRALQRSEPPVTPRGPLRSTGTRQGLGAFEVRGPAACPGSNGSPSISGSGTPVPGGRYTVRVRQAAPLQPVILVTGGSATSWAGLELPLPLTPLGLGPGCALRVAVQSTVSTVASAAGTASIAFPVPSDPSLAGRSFHHCWLVADPAAAAGLTISNALGVTIGLPVAARSTASR